jgi:hypothetical protein
MMTNALLTEVRKKIPKNPQLVKMLADILFIEKEAIYRRLRGEVPFTFNEIVVIAKRLNISLDNIIGIDVKKSTPFQLRLPNFISPKEKDVYMLDSYIDFLQSVGEKKDSEIGLATNVLPQDIFSGYEYLTKFNVFNWQYHYKNDNMLCFKELTLSDVISQFFKRQYIESKTNKLTYYIFDNHIFSHFVNNVKYFHAIRLIEKEDVLKIKEELFQVLDYLEEMTIKGRFKETGNKVYLYISGIDIITNYSYIIADDIIRSLIKTFILTSITSADEETFERMKNWIHSLIKVSTLITGTGEKERIMYFEKQREVVSYL